LPPSKSRAAAVEKLPSRLLFAISYRFLYQ